MKTTILSTGTSIQFEELTSGPPDNIAMAIFGRPGTGKTRMMATAPGLGCIPLQRKTRPTVESVMRELYPKRKIYWPKEAERLYKYDNPLAMALMEREESKKFHRELFNLIRDACFRLLEMRECRTVGIDSGYTLYDIVLAAHYGKAKRFISGADQKVAYGPPNDEYRELLISMQSKHLVITTEAGEVYVGSKGQGWDEPKGYKSVGYDTNVLIETHSPACGKLHGHAEDPSYWVDVRICQDRAALMGTGGQKLLVDDMCEFKFLAQEIRPGGSIEDWE